MPDKPVNPFQPLNKARVGTDLTDIWGHVQQTAWFDWENVDSSILKAALLVSFQKGIPMMIGPAMGGRGAIVTVYTGAKPPPKRHALDAVEMTAMLQALIDGWASPSEDPVALMRMLGSGDRSLAAD